MKDKAFQTLRFKYKQYLKDKNSNYFDLKGFSLNIGLFSRQEIETMETEQDDINNLK